MALSVVTFHRTDPQLLRGRQLATLNIEKGKYAGFTTSLEDIAHLKDITPRMTIEKLLQRVKHGDHVKRLHFPRLTHWS